MLRKLFSSHNPITMGIFYLLHILYDEYKLQETYNMARHFKTLNQCIWDKN